MCIDAYLRVAPSNFLRSFSLLLAPVLCEKVDFENSDIPVDFLKFGHILS